MNKKVTEAADLAAYIKYCDRKKTLEQCIKIACNKHDVPYNKVEIELDSRHISKMRSRKRFS